MALVKDWRKEIEKLDADEIHNLIESFNTLDAWPIMGREYGELRTIRDMLQRRADFLSEADDETAKCLACNYRVDGLCPLDAMAAV